MGRERKIPTQCIIRGTVGYVLLMIQPSAPLVILLKKKKKKRERNRRRDCREEKGKLDQF